MHVSEVRPMAPVHLAQPVLQFLVKHQVPKVWQTSVLYSMDIAHISSSFPQAKDTLKGNKFEDVEMI
jgi:hypothetical protein